MLSHSSKNVDRNQRSSIPTKCTLNMVIPQPNQQDERTLQSYHRETKNQRGKVLVSYNLHQFVTKYGNSTPNQQDERTLVDDGEEKNVTWMLFIDQSGNAALMEASNLNTHTKTNCEDQDKVIGSASRPL